MKIGTVTGSVWSSRKAQCLQGQTFLVVDTMLGPVVAADEVGAGKGTRYCWSPERLPVNSAWRPRWMRWWSPSSIRTVSRTGRNRKS